MLDWIDDPEVVIYSIDAGLKFMRVLVYRLPDRTRFKVIPGGKP